MSRTTRTLLLALAAAMLVATAPRGAADAAQEGWRRFPGELAHMVRFLKLSDPEQERLLAIVERQAEARKAQETTHAQKQKENEARRKAIQEQMKPLLEQIKPYQKQLEELKKEEHQLHKERRSLHAVQEAEIEAFFTPDQRFRYARYQLAREVIHRYGAAKLNEQQVARVNALAEAALMEINRIETDDRRERDRAEREIRNRLNRQVFDEVLTEDQQIAVQAKWLYYEIGRRLPGVRLNQEQLDRLLQMCRPPVVAWRKVPEDEQKDAWQKTIDETRQAVVESLLTDQQRARLK